MNVNEIKVGRSYRCAVSGKMTTVQILNESPYGGWDALNKGTNRKLRIKCASRLKGMAKEETEAAAPVEPVVPKKPSALSNKLKQAKNNALDNIIVIALAGTGKTFTMIVGIAYTFLLPLKPAWRQVIDKLGFEPIPSEEQKKVWDEIAKSRNAKTITYCAFNKSIVTEFGDKFDWMLLLLKRAGIMFNFSTINSMGHKVCMQAYGRIKPTNWHTKNVLATLMECDIRELEKNDPDFVQAVDGLVAMCKLTLAGWTKEDGYTEPSEEEMDEIVKHHDIELGGKRDKVYDMTIKVLKESMSNVKGEIDFNDQNWLPIVCNLPIPTVDFIMVDEGQDLPRCKQEFAIRAGRRVMLVGDINQAIYGFAGADVDSIPRMTHLLGKNGTPVSPLFLTETRRCGKKVVEKANQTLRQCYNHRKETPIEFKAHESNDEGIVESMDFNKYTEVLEDGDMVLCRVNAPIISQALKLIKEGRKAIIRGRDFGQQLINFIKKFKAADVGALIEGVDEWYQRESQKEAKKRNPSENKLIAMEDKKDCIMAFCEDAKSVEEVISNLNLVFAGRQCPRCKGHFNDELDRCPNYKCKTEIDPVSGWKVGPKLVTPEGVMFSTIHRAKGLEAQNVFILYKDAPIPHPMAKTHWQYGQELNLLYVAQSRAKNRLVEVY